jgi:hypothetical protein
MHLPPPLLLLPQTAAAGVGGGEEEEEEEEEEVVEEKARYAGGRMCTRATYRSSGARASPPRLPPGSLPTLSPTDTCPRLPGAAAHARHACALGCWVRANWRDLEISRSREIERSREISRSKDPVCARELERERARAHTHTHELETSATRAPPAAATQEMSARGGGGRVPGAEGRREAAKRE